MLPNEYFTQQKGSFLFDYYFIVRLWGTADRELGSWLLAAFVILRKASVLKTNNNGCNKQDSIQNEFILRSVGRCNLVSKVLDSTPASVANCNTKYL
jgi:hypothetical protein